MAVIINLVPTMIISSEVSSWDDIIYEKRDCDGLVDAMILYGGEFWEDYEACTVEHDGPIWSLLIGMLSIIFIFFWRIGGGNILYSERIPKKYARLYFHYMITFNAACSFGGWLMFENQKHVFYDSVGNVSEWDYYNYSTPNLFLCYLILLLPYLLFWAITYWLAKTDAFQFEVEEDDSSLDTNNDGETYVQAPFEEYLELPIHFDRRKPWVELCEAHGFLTKNQSIEKMSKRLNAYNKLIDYRHRYGTKISKTELVDIANYCIDLIQKEEKQIVESILKKNPTLQYSDMTVLELLKHHYLH
ncbi:hypothetical protein N9K54_00595 [Candidatus Poseidonia alphae]|nr:hypothetical protein [Candidatus Poseidonia alphae]